MAKNKLNCWEHKKCGREPGGEKVQELGECPASLELKLNGSNNGLNGGRACWVMKGTLCANQIQGSFSSKFQNCKKCDFYKTVVAEEGEDLNTINDLYGKLD